jgi:hypothetical protein
MAAIMNAQSVRRKNATKLLTCQQLQALVHDLVDDPYEHGKMLGVVRSLRDDRLALLRNRGHILQHQFAAGRAWQQLYEHAEIGGARSLDPGKLRVDTSGGNVVVAARRLRAVKRLVRIRRRVGARGEALLYGVLVDGLTLGELGAPAARLRSCLDTVAHELQLA